MWSGKNSAMGEKPKESRIKPSGKSAHNGNDRGKGPEAEASLAGLEKPPRPLCRNTAVIWDKYARRMKLERMGEERGLSGPEEDVSVLPSEIRSHWRRMA